MKIIKLNDNTAHPETKTEALFDQFLKEFEQLSNRFGIAIKFVDSIEMFDPMTSQVTYRGDVSYGDLEPYVHPRKRETKFQVEVTECPSRRGS